eukprot:1158984-Pelagomonas_calceolata.AAC.8
MEAFAAYLLRVCTPKGCSRQHQDKFACQSALGKPRAFGKTQQLALGQTVRLHAARPVKMKGNSDSSDVTGYRKKKASSQNG